MKDIVNTFEFITKIYNIFINKNYEYIIQKNLTERIFIVKQFIDNEFVNYNLKFIGSGTSRVSYCLNDNFCIKFQVPVKYNETQQTNNEIQFFNSIENCDWIVKTYAYDTQLHNTILCELGKPLCDENLKKIINISLDEFCDFLQDLFSNGFNIYCKTVNLYKFLYDIKYNKDKKYENLRNIFKLGVDRKILDVFNHRNFIVVNRCNKDLIVVCDCGECKQ